MKILIVEDSSVIIKLVSGMLTEMGHKVEVAKNGREGIDTLEKGNTFDLTLLDWNMPVLDGEGFLVEADKKKLPAGNIVMMTTENSPQKILRAVSLGAKEYIKTLRQRIK